MTRCGSGCRSSVPAWVGFLVMDGLAQAAGVVVAIAGIKSRWYQLVLTEGVQVQVLPVPMGRAGEGLALVGRFSGLWGIGAESHSTDLEGGQAGT